MCKCILICCMLLTVVFGLTALAIYCIMAKETITGRCVLRPVLGKAVAGTILFTQHKSSVSSSGVSIKGTIIGLREGIYKVYIYTSDHGFDNCSSVGDQFNPDTTVHSSPFNVTRLIEDLGDIYSDVNERAFIHVLDRVLDLKGPGNILGRTLGVAAKEDDRGKGGDVFRSTGFGESIVACCLIIAA